MTELIWIALLLIGAVAAISTSLSRRRLKRRAQESEQALATHSKALRESVKETRTYATRLAILAAIDEVALGGGSPGAIVDAALETFQKTLDLKLAAVVFNGPQPTAMVTQGVDGPQGLRLADLESIYGLMNAMRRGDPFHLAVHPDAGRKLGIPAEVRSVNAFPLGFSEGLEGVMLLGTETESPLPPHQRQMAEELTQRLAVALRSARQRDLPRQRLGAIMEAAGSTAIFGVDHRAGITIFSSGAERLLGFEAAQVLGASPTIFFDSDELAAAGAEVGASGDEVLIALAQQGGAPREWTLIRSDGSRFPVLMTISRVRDAEGESDSYVAVASDISALRSAQEELEASVSVLSATLESTEEGILSLDPQGEVSGSNSQFAAMWGLDARRLEQGDIGEFASRLQDELVADTPLLRPLASPTSTDDVLDGDVELTDGRVIHIHSRPQRSSEGIIGRVWTFRDVTAMTRAREEISSARDEAERANQAKSEFLSRMSHELRTPLSAILGFAQLLEMEEELTQEQAEAIDQILHGGSHLLELINELLDLSRIEQGRLSLQLESVDVGSVINETTTLVSSMASGSGIGVQVLESPREARALADRRRLLQVALNLVSNAIKYNRPGGQVRLGWEREGEHVLIHVEDDGVGIPHDRLVELFQPFSRLGADMGSVEGTGLGLTLSQRLTEKMGGWIDVDSRVGVGSRFTVNLMAADSGPDRVRDAPIPARKILLIEDDMANVLLIDRILAPFGVELLSAMQGRVGLDIARNRRPDLILLDQQLPDMDSAEVLQQLKEDPSVADAQVVVLMVEPSEHAVEGFMSRGAQAWVRKPLVMGDFLETLRPLLEDRADRPA